MSVSTDWSMDRTVEDMVNAGAFGSNCTVVSCEQDDRQTGQDHYSSTVHFGTVTIELGDHEGRRGQHQLVFKLKHRTLEMRIMFRNDFQFHNEILFYETIWPYMLSHVPVRDSDHRVPPLPRYFYGRNLCGDFTLQDLVVVENETPRGYRLSKSQLYLDFDHMTVALKTLAKFHGLSYRAKYKDSSRFSKLIADVKNTEIFDNAGGWSIKNHVLQGLLSAALGRLAERHRSEKDEYRMRRFLIDMLSDIKRTIRQILEPQEPLAVLCHGDFNRNNLLFRYDDSGKPVDAMAFDMATVRYGSPALDLSFFLYMNTDRQFRDKHWDELLDTYCASLAAALSDVANEVPTLNRPLLDTEMRNHAFYGLAHVSFFARILLEEEKQVIPSDFFLLDEHDMLSLFLSFGGDKATDVVADVVQHFIDTRYNEKLPLSSH